ncbi:MAG: glutamate racemase [Desulfobacteraceae bacterium IS3]|nr:MAG: glutamate racemase [Desulfobacteraceae bacterium IS3]
MIGIFDSGIGGLTVVRALTDRLPGHDIIYFGDTARTPYGNKSPETIIRYALEDTEFLLNKGAKLIVMACNTASSVATEHIIEKFHVPVFEVITPAVLLSIETSKKHRIGVIGTRATINSGVYEKKIMSMKPEAKVWSAPCPLLVPLVEEGWLEKPETAMIVKKYLIPLKVRQIDTLILGCTHYPILKKTIQRKIGMQVNIIDSSLSVAEKVKVFLAQHPETDELLSKTGASEFFVSDVTGQFRKTAKILLGKNISLTHVK